jgi:hypothetical protein
MVADSYNTKSDKDHLYLRYWRRQNLHHEEREGKALRFSFVHLTCTCSCAACAGTSVVVFVVKKRILNVRKENLSGWEVKHKNILMRKDVF